MNLNFKKTFAAIFLVSNVLPGYAFAAKTGADIKADSIRFEKIVLANGETRKVDAKAAAFHTNGRCMFDTSYVTYNSGKGDAPKKFINVLKVNDKLVRRNNIPELKSGQKEESKFLLALSTGENKMELLLDVSNDIDETSEKNNRYTANLVIDGKCSGKSKTEKKKPKPKPNPKPKPKPKPKIAPAPNTTK